MKAIARMLGSSLEIRLRRRRYRVAFSGEMAGRGFGADHFRPFAERAPVSDPGRPGRGENAGILDRELELQPLALVVGIAGEARIGALQAGQVALAALLRFDRGLGAEQAIA